jgi:N-acylneuraminate cytidylyltransferase
MITWPIRTAKASGCFDRIIVSTDSEDIARVALDAGAEVPFYRPAHLADDHALTREVVVHAIDWLCTYQETPTAVACLYPTAVLLTRDDILEGFRTLNQDGVLYSLTITEFEFPIQRAVRLTQGREIEMMQPEHAETRSQDLEPFYHDAGALYWGKPSAFRQAIPIFGSQTRAVVLPRDRAIDIDTMSDLHLAEARLHALLDASSK